jgi:hypothetical protein
MEFTMNWTGLGEVFIAALGFTTVIVAAFALGIRLLSSANFQTAKVKIAKSKDLRREIGLRTLAYIAFAICLLAVAYEIYLIVPYFHLAK